MTLDAPLHILTVCTGNICRSPAAERLLARALGPAVEVSSAGTGALVSRPIEPAMAGLMEDAGVPAGAFRARQANPRLIAAADLVLALSEQHRSWVLNESPAALKKTFTLLRFAHLVGEPRVADAGDGCADVAAWLRAVVPAAFRHRSLGCPCQPGAEDVPDPYGRRTAAFLDSFGKIRAATEAIARAAGGPGLG